MTVGINARVI